MLEWLREVKSSGRKVVGIFGAEAIAPIILACGAVPLRLFGAAADERVSRRKLPRDTCALAASFFAGAETLAREKLLDAVLISATCDWKRKLADVISGLTTVFMLESPLERDPASVERELRSLARQVAVMTDLPVTVRNLRSASDKLGVVERAFASLLRVRRLRGSSFSGAEGFVVGESFMKDDVCVWAERCLSLAQSIAQTAEMDKTCGDDSAPRILLVGSPAAYEHGSPIQLIEQAGGRVVCDDSHSRLSWLYSSNFSERSDGVCFPSLSSRWAATCFCSLIGTEGEDCFMRAIDDFSVDGVVVHIYRTCARLQMKTPGFLRRLKEKGIPFLVLETEGDPNDTGRLLVRIEPFMEMLVAAKRRRM
jgi:benzoyl-CoA reductase/2-hydroxyglutaryl-CoA dehydratase subunit BcrC/BadD/HgdB